MTEPSVRNCNHERTARTQTNTKDSYICYMRHDRPRVVTAAMIKKESRQQERSMTRKAKKRQEKL